MHTVVSSITQATAAVAAAAIYARAFYVQIVAASVWVATAYVVVDAMKSRKIAFGAVVAALSLVLMLLTGIMPFGTYAFPCFAGILLVAIVIDFGVPWALGVYAGISVLSLLLVSDKEAALYYVLILGIYPILKSLFERIKLKWLSFTVKLVYFNLMAVAAFFISIYVLAVPVDSFSIFGVNMPLLFLVLGNGVFVVYDICVTRLIYVYVNIWHNRFKF